MKFRKTFMAIASIILIVAIIPFFIQVPPVKGTYPVQELADSDSLFVNIDNIRVHYKIAGEGDEALILLHGFAASTYSWREVIQPLAQANRVVAFDRPAFGLTERPLDWDDKNPYELSSQVELMIGLMDHLNIGKAILVGNSAGGTVSVLTALAYPERVKALVLVDPAIYTTGGNRNLIQFLSKLPQVDHLGPLFVRGIREWGLEFGKSAWHDPSLITPEIWDGYTKPLMAENWDRGLWEMYTAAEKIDITGRLADLSLPVLVITGDDDRIVPTADSIRLAGEIPGASLSVIPNCGHVPQEECPQEFLDITTKFISQIP